MTSAPNLRSIALRAASAVALVVGTAACSLLESKPDSAGIGFREARFEAVTAIRDYRACQEEGLALDKQAFASGSAATYLTSARVLEKCEAKLGPAVAGVGKDERMRVYALSIQNYFKGGDVDAARKNFDSFRAAFPDNDLYYADGTSFVSTMDALIGRREPWSFGEFATLNVSDDLRSEIRRIHYWKSR